MNVCKVASRIRLHRLADRLADNPFKRKSSSLYYAQNVRVIAELEDMGDFFSYLKNRGCSGLRCTNQAA